MAWNKMDTAPKDGTKMDTAPKDGTKIIACTRYDAYVPWVFWNGKGWISESVQWSGGPIAWQPFPPPPPWSEAEEEADG